MPDPNSTNPTPDGETPQEPQELLEPSVSSAGRRVLLVAALKALEGLKTNKKKGNKMFVFYPQYLETELQPVPGTCSI